MMFLRTELLVGAIPLIAVDGPPGEIRRTIRLTYRDPELANTNTYSFTLGFGLDPIVTETNQTLPDFQANPVDMLTWFYRQCEQNYNDSYIYKDGKAIGPNNKWSPIRLIVFMYDVSIIKNDPVITSLVSAITDPDGVAIKTGSCIVLCGPGIIQDLPAELREQALKKPLELPRPDEIEKLLQDIHNDAPSVASPSKEHLQHIAREAAGMSTAQINNAAICSLFEKHAIDPVFIRQEVRQLLVDMPGVDLLSTDGLTLDSMGGYSFAKNALRKLIDAYNKPLANPKGVLLYGPPGTGKSFVGKCLGGDVGWKVLLVSPSEFKDKYVGETSKNMARFTKLAEAIAPCIVILDEVDGAFGSQGASKESNSSGDMLTIFLSWQAERTGKHPIFTIATCNRLDTLPPEFSRDGRFDMRLFMDVPGRDTKDSVWNLYVKKFGIDSSQPLPQDTDWTGSEIEACCRNSYVFDLTLQAAAARITPVVKRMGDKMMDYLREIASRSCLSAETGRPVGAETPVVNASSTNKRSLNIPPPPV